MYSLRALVSLFVVATFAGCATGENLDNGGAPRVDAGSTGAASGATSGGGASSGGASPSGGTGATPSDGGSAGGTSQGGTGGGGSLPDASAGDAMPSGGTAGAAGADAGVGPACADPAQKSCNGVCAVPSPAIGCDLTDCVACTAVTNGFPQCVAGACDFGCLSGYQRSGTGCTSGGTGGTGGTGGAGCSDGTKNGSETDVDCGGSCSKCSDGKTCGAASDCSSSVCKAGGFLNPTKKCQSATCKDGVRNGAETDVDCGGNCGATCVPGKICAANGDCSKGPCNAGICGCTALTCAAAGTQCGSLSDNCGGQITCGCTAPQVCNAGQCCTPLTACAAGKCGVVPDGCGSTLDCGLTQCAAGDVCSAGACCLPLATCPSGKCGQQSNGCGGTLDCTSNCGSGEVCNAGACCTPNRACPANVCAANVADGCGGSVDCTKNCAGGQVCNAGACCTPLTACAAGQCGTVSDGCLGTINCPTCASPQTCGGAGVVNQCGCGDGDADGLDDCTETNDGDPWTDPTVFNGLEAMLDTDGGGNCNELSDYETMSSQFRAPAQQHNVYSGWDFSTNDDAANAPGFGIKPPFTSTDTGFRIRYRGQINLPQDGEYCFKVDAASTGGGTPDECVQVYVNQAPGPGGKWLAQNGYNGPVSQQVGCVTVTAGVYPIDLVFQSANTGHLHTFHPTFCFGGAAACTPTTPLTQKYLRPPDCLDSSECQCEYYGGHAYRMCRTNRAWAAAQTQCTTAGMKMVRLDSAAEDTLVYGTMNARGSNTAWIGATDATTEGTWVWPDGAQFWSGAAAGTAVGGLFTTWAGGEPNNAGGNEDCARYFAASTWGDVNCTNTSYYVCEAY